MSLKLQLQLGDLGMQLLSGINCMLPLYNMGHHVSRQKVFNTNIVDRAIFDIVIVTQSFQVFHGDP